MCGIAGCIAKNDSGKGWNENIVAAAHEILMRGPDAQNFFREENIALGHCRLTIIDLSDSANQPMYDESERFVTIYNGEIFNFKELKKNLEASGISFRTQSDTEVLLQLYSKHGTEMLHLLNGFFAFAIYDRTNKSCFIARDRFGVKPLVYYEDESHLVFASEIKALLKFPVQKKLDELSLYEYLQLNYIPAPKTIFEGVKKLLPGHFIFYQSGKVEITEYYSLQKRTSDLKTVFNYEDAQSTLFELMSDSVRLRLISDVPLGSFLSGGIDSSIVSGLASLFTEHLQTFSIGYKEDEFFDETDYARLVAKHFRTEHTVFSLSRSDLFESLDSVLNYLDEPFADSSALPVYVLSQHTRKHVKVALSGDGADELFGGYLKHLAEFRARNPGLIEKSASLISPLSKVFPKSRHSRFGNALRQLKKFGEGMDMTVQDRYWRWATLATAEQANEILVREIERKKFEESKNDLTRLIKGLNGLNDVMLNDVHLVLPNDMLHKVDSMSMANGLEVRTPFLDYRVAEFAFSIPSSFKVDRRHRKKIVHDAFRDFLPKELYHRPKRGFEIPLHSFLTRELQSHVNESLSSSFIHEQNIFNSKAVDDLKEQLFSNNPGDSAARVWGLLVFQHWWKKFM